MKRKYYWLETGWRILFKALAILFIALTVAGIGIGSGAVAWNSHVLPITGKAQKLAASNDASADGQQGGTQQAADDTEQQASAADDTTSDDANANVTVGKQSKATEKKSKDGTTTVAESKGPTSLTYGDLSVAELPKGIVKLPDESLWIVNVGPVNEANLNDPRCSYTDDEKARLLQAANAQRIAELRGTAADALKSAGDSVGDAIDKAGNAATNGAKGSGNFLINLLNNLTGLNVGSDVSTENIKKGPQWGFMGITPYTSS